MVSFQQNLPELQRQLFTEKREEDDGDDERKLHDAGGNMDLPDSEDKAVRREDC